MKQLNGHNLLRNDDNIKRKSMMKNNCKKIKIILKWIKAIKIDSKLNV